jgi:prophage DNA circulation protein
MSWSETLLSAQFRGIKFDVVVTDDSAQRATVEHAYPYRDGANVEDLGRGARRVTCEAIFYGDDYEQRLRAFLAVLDTAGEGDLQHPVFGLIFAQVASYRIHHEADHVDQARISLEFIESTPAQPFFDHSLPSQKAEAIGAAASAATVAAGEALGQTVDKLAKANPLAALTTLRAALLGPLNAALAIMQGYIASGLDVLAEPRAWAADIAGLAGTALDTIAFFAGQPGALMNDWRTAATLLGQLLPSTGGGSGTQIAAGSAPTEAQAVTAAQVTQSVTLSASLATAAQLVLAAEAETATLSPVEIETVANSVRDSIEATMLHVRACYPLEIARSINEPLKDAALAIQVAAAAIINARPPLLDRGVESPACLRLLAHRWYGDHGRALELLRLNGLRLPNFIQPGDVLHAYAR